jgi:hypothetical protein
MAITVPPRMRQWARNAHIGTHREKEKLRIGAPSNAHPLGEVVVDSIERAADERRDMSRTQEAVPVRCRTISISSLVRRDAKTRDLPLLFKGNDFASTDIRPAFPSRP